MNTQKTAKIQAPVVITAHNNADFDAFAAMIAASKLYPGAVLIFPGSQEKNLKNFVIQSATYLFDFKNAKEIDPESVKTMVLVDTRQRSRLSHMHAILSQASPEVHVYDHHPDSDDDLPYSQGIVVPWGSATAILVHELRKKDISISADEATILGCGIFEDTGSFTFVSTTEHDFEAAAWLKKQQMDLTFISDLLHRGLTAEQIAILNQLLESATTHDINGVPIIITEVSLNSYMGDFALLVHKMLEMENIRTLFALGRMQDRIQLVARSRTPDVDAGQICASFGGGGHSFAASASIKDKTLSQVKDELFALLYSHINPQLLVKNLMSKPAVVIDREQPIADAHDIMGRYGLKALPVVQGKDKTFVGIIEQTIAEKAMAHHLENVPLGEYMLRDCSVITPDADLYPVMEIILGQRQRLVPVMENNVILGVITRTDLINILIEEPARIPETLLPEKKRERSIKTLLNERLPKSYYKLLKEAGELAAELGFEAYAVGGFVRDILLRRKNLDLDIVVEGDGIAFARALGEKLGGRVRAHTKFKTAVIILKDEHGHETQHIDVATARLEYYEYPAALPTVELSSIKMDLFRRDFTINAVAVQLNPGEFGRLVDFFGAQRDIKDKVLRVIHSLSFVEDPTRILRAVRFEQRFHFEIGGQTRRLIKNALTLNLFKRLSGARIFQELRLIMDEERPLDCIRSLHNYGILQAIHPVLNLTPVQESRCEEVSKVLNWYKLLFIDPLPRPWILYLMCLCSQMHPEQILSLLKRLGLTKRDTESFMNTNQLTQATKDPLMYWVKKKGKLSDLYFMLEPIQLEGILYLMATNRHEEVRKHLSYYLTQLQHVTIEISGKDLKKLGIPEGPIYSIILNQIRAAKIDGVAPTLLAQYAFAQKFAKKLAAEQSDLFT